MKRAALVTGGTGVLGQALVSGFLSASWDVVTTSRASAEEVMSRFPGWRDHHAGKCLVIRVDLEEQGAMRIIERFLESNGAMPAVLINNARNIGHLRLGEDGRPGRAGWLREFELDVRVAYELTMTLAEMPSSRLESVINVSSMYGLVAANPALYEDFESQSPVHYGVAKAALNHLTKELAVRLAPRKIRVNTVSYGGVEGRADQAFVERYSRMCPQGRMLAPQEVVGPAVFLASGASSGITGHNLIVDGGWSVW